LVNGPAWKALIEEEFGDGIMSAIDFDMQIERLPNPKGDRVKITMSGKFLPYKYYGNSGNVSEYGYKEEGSAPRPEPQRRQRAHHEGGDQRPDRSAIGENARQGARPGPRGLALCDGFGGCRSARDVGVGLDEHLLELEIVDHAIAREVDARQCLHALRQEPDIRQLADRGQQEFAPLGAVGLFY